MIVTITTRQQYADHLAPILALLDLDVPGPDIALVASHLDLVAARRRFTRFILAQHGAGQSYGGDPRAARIDSYPGGDDNGDVGLFLAPNEHAANRWRTRYPSAAVRVVGSPRLEALPAREQSPATRTIQAAGDSQTICISFHWQGRTCAEAHSAYGEYAPVLKDLSRRFDLIGHCHPLRRDVPKFWRSIGVEYVPSFDDVCRRADLYVCDNSSTIFEFASTGRPVVLLNSKRYRRNVDHGLRFWDAAGVGLQIDRPEDLADGIIDALEHDDPDAREAALSLVYPIRSGAAQLAADAIREWTA